MANKVEKMDKLWYNPRETRIRKDGKIEHYCEVCETWKEGFFHMTPEAWYWRCDSCKEAGRTRKQMSLFDEY